MPQTHQKKKPHYQYYCSQDGNGSDLLYVSDCDRNDPMKMCCGCIESAPPALNTQPKVKFDKYILYKLKLKARMI